jgi:mannose-1-phosphate guanylyltransferase
MKVVIFAGGVGTRLWPLSRKKNPKQFEKLIGNDSTLQLAVRRLYPEISSEDIFISTGKIYKDLVSRQLKEIPKKNIIGEPEKKDVGPAVCLMMGVLAQQFPNEPVLILWSDHLVHEEKKFKKLIFTAEKLIKEEKHKIIFIGQKPRFASDNLGWIERGKAIKKIDDVFFYQFCGFKYKPDKLLAEKYFNDQRYCWNLGYFISTPLFIFNLFKRFSPKIYNLVKKILAFQGKKDFQRRFEELYRQMPEINFDNAILEQLDKSFAYVVVEDIGWSDIGAWEALKEALQKNSEDNIIKGEVILKDSKDNLVYSLSQKKLVVGIDLENMLVVDTQDILLIAKKTSVAKIKKLVESFAGTKYEKFT